jgi:hypothetical protein
VRFLTAFFAGVFFAGVFLVAFFFGALPPTHASFLAVFGLSALYLPFLPLARFGLLVDDVLFEPQLR